MQNIPKLDKLQLIREILKIVKTAPFLGAVFLFIFPLNSLSYNNIVLISIDTLRPDYLGFNGRNPSPSPFLDIISKKSVIFSNAITPVPLTLPSHSSIFTGLYPFNHKIRDNGKGKLSKDLKTIAKFLKEKGYQTFAVIGSYVLSSRFGISNGFDIYDDLVYKDGKEKRTFVFKERDAKKVLENSLNLFEKLDKKKPYFIFIHFFDPHAPYENHKISKNFNNYEEEIAYVDICIKELFEKIDDGKTIWIIISDHGEAFGEHNEFTHGFLAYNTTLKILFMIYAPWLFNPQKINERVSNIDLFPTIANIFGEEIKVDGVSLLPVINKNKMEKREFYFESFYARMNFTNSPIYGIFIDNFKIILPEPFEVYDILNDPNEEVNLSKTKKAYIKKAILKTKKIIENNNFVEGDLHSQRILRSLGYISGSSKSNVEKVSPKVVFHYYSEISKIRDNFLLEKKIFPFKEYEDFLKRFPKCSILAMELGMGYLREGNKDKAIYWLKEAIKYDENLIEAWHDLGNIYYFMKDFKSAEEIYKKVIEIDKDFPYSYLSLGKIYYDKGEIEKAKEYWEKFMELDPGDENVPKIRKLLKIGG